MTEKILSFDPEELNEHRKGNFFVLMTLPLHYFKKKKIPIAEYAISAGELLAKSWEVILGAPLSQVAFPIAMNYAALGATDIKYKEEKRKFIIIINNWPPADWLEFMEITKEDFEQFNRCWEPIAKVLAMKFEFISNENNFEIIFSE
ncbi:MAG: hypothetical protein FK730_00375 [Asgard group archaeon]|nr:hypothetical protein [Asgard group archaeon]